ncbi:MAG: RagB/SusD family nutrient uptake outer membrane protein [Microscillaceae bacterium]|nr:RagB/SusD family nutrient uptake outer membrane protein [Microscillaceae bacterium]
MLKKIFQFFLIASFVGIISSCEDSLTKVRRDALTPDLALKEVSGFESLLFSAYESVNDFTYYGQTVNVGPEILADNLKLINRTGRYEGQEVNAIGEHIDLWRRYETINECNFIINDIDAIEGDAARKAQIKGEAYFLRALAYHDLLRTYAYEPGKEVNGWTEGVILRTTPTRSAPDADLRTRSTVQEGYTLVEADLLEAVTLLSANAPAASTFPYRANVAAARALLARVYLYAGRYADAATQADQALASTTASLTTAAQYDASWAATPHPESLFESEIVLANWSTVDGVNNSMNSLTMNIFPSAQFIIGASDDLIAAFETGDIRRNIWEASGANFTCRKWRGEKGNFLENVPVIRYSDVLLIAAEGKARSGNEAGARTDLSRLRTNRGLAEVDAGLSGQNLLDLILQERRVELCLEGHRFYDLKRLGLNISKPAPNPPIQYSDFRVLSRIPVEQVQLNPSLEQNPGYN